MNYDEIRKVYDNVENNELVTQTGYEFKLFDDYYYQLFHSYREADQHDYLTFNSIILCDIVYNFNLYSVYEIKVFLRSC